jgi:hypothetical protein
MKSFIIAAALAGLAATTPLSAQGRIIPTNRTNQTNCSYNGSTVGSIVFGRNSSSNCRYGSNGNRVDGQWYQIGQDGNGNVIYERRVQDGNGNIILQRARQDAYGNMSIISSQNVGNNGTWNNGSRNGTWNNSSRSARRRDTDDQGNYNRRTNGSYNSNNGSYDRNNPSYNRNNASYNRNAGNYNNGKSEHKDKDKGKGKKDRD